MTVTGSGHDADLAATGSVRQVVVADPTLIMMDGLELGIVRYLNGDSGLPGATLTGTWTGQSTPVPLAYASVPGDPRN
jgi:hypothetical protein